MYIPKKFNKNSLNSTSECKEFKKWFLCIIKGVQEFQEFLGSSRNGLFTLSQDILKNIFMENYSNLIILKY